MLAIFAVRVAGAGTVYIYLFFGQQLHFEGATYGCLRRLLFTASRARAWGAPLALIYALRGLLAAYKLIRPLP